jgi:hypothetical protein
MMLTIEDPTFCGGTVEKRIDEGEKPESASLPIIKNCNAKMTHSYHLDHPISSPVP